tara:strand:+ start:879 stop:1544 length:666 start_codon:yes stop_codon:yes gene_type:complete
MLFVFLVPALTFAFFEFKKLSAKIILLKETINSLSNTIVELDKKCSLLQLSNEYVEGNLSNQLKISELGSHSPAVEKTYQFLPYILGFGLVVSLSVLVYFSLSSGVLAKDIASHSLTANSHNSSEITNRVSKNVIEAISGNDSVMVSSFQSQVLQINDRTNLLNFNLLDGITKLSSKIDLVNMNIMESRALLKSAPDLGIAAVLPPDLSLVGQAGDIFTLV